MLVDTHVEKKKGRRIHGEDVVLCNVPYSTNSRYPQELLFQIISCPRSVSHRETLCFFPSLPRTCYYIVTNNETNFRHWFEREVHSELSDKKLNPSDVIQGQTQFMSSYPTSVLRKNDESAPPIPPPTPFLSPVSLPSRCFSGDIRVIARRLAWWWW